MTTPSPAPVTAPPPGSSAPTISAAPGTPSPHPHVPAPGSPALAPSASEPTPDLWAGLSAENREIVKNKNWGDLNAAIKSYSDLEKAHSSRPAVPTPPADVSGYTFGKPSDLPAGVQYDEGFANKFKEWAFARKLPVDMAQGLHDDFVAYAAEASKSANDQFAATVATVKNELNQTWGPDESPAYNRQLELSMRAADKLGIKDDLKQLGAFVDVGGKMAITNAKVAKALAQVGNAMFAEDTIHGDPSQGINPFDPKTQNITLAGQIFKQDPLKAKALIYAAGQQHKFADLLASIK